MKTIVISDKHLWVRGSYDNQASWSNHTYQLRCMSWLIREMLKIFGRNDEVERVVSEIKMVDIHFTVVDIRISPFRPAQSAFRNVHSYNTFGNFRQIGGAIAGSASAIENILADGKLPRKFVYLKMILEILIGEIGNNPLFCRQISGLEEAKNFFQLAV